MAACALYLKDHSYGEYVFDWAWANAYEQHGLAYYPKALVAPPFTPVPGARLLARDAAAREALVAALIAWCTQEKLSSLHLLFCSDDDIAACTSAGLMLRHTVQFHWKNVAPTLAAARLRCPPRGAIRLGTARRRTGGPHRTGALAISEQLRLDFEAFLASLSPGQAQKNPPGAPQGGRGRRHVPLGAWAPTSAPPTGTFSTAATNAPTSNTATRPTSRATSSSAWRAPCPRTGCCSWPSAPDSPIATSLIAIEQESTGTQGQSDSKEG